MRCTERNARIPPLEHLRKARNRLDRLKELSDEMHPALTPNNATRLPPSRTRQNYLEEFDIVTRDYQRILDDLIGDG